MKQLKRIPYRWIVPICLVLLAGWWSVSVITAQPPIPHAVPANLEVDCLSCHQAGVAGAPRLAFDHLGRANKDCSQCHAISGNFSVSIPHPVESRAECYDCHLDGSSGAPRVAGNHASYGTDTCQMCHQLDVVEEEAAGEEVVEEEEGPHILWGLDAGKTCLECHRQQFNNDNHLEIVQIEPKESKREFLWDAYCSECHGEDGLTEVFPAAMVNAQKEEILADMQAEAAKKAREEAKKAEEEVAREADEDATEKSDENVAEATEEKEELVKELTLDDVEFEPEADSGLIINSPEYMSTHDDAHIMLSIIAHPHNPDHVFARSQGGALKAEDIKTLGEAIREWGPMGPELDYPIPSFSEDVYPIIKKECGGQCHLDKQKGGWSMAGYEDMMTKGEHAPNVIIPGDPDNSLLAQKLRNVQTEGEMMPTDRRLKPAQVSLIVEWIRAGAPGDN